MTAQIADSLRHRGKVCSLWTLPLEPFLDRFNNRKVFAQVHRHTACFRGYVGYWEIFGNMLFLNGVETLDGENFPLELLFHQVRTPIFADWYSGELRCPTGKILKYVHNGFESIFSREDWILIRNGVVEAEGTINNPLPPLIDPIEEFDIPDYLKD